MMRDIKMETFYWHAYFTGSSHTMSTVSTRPYPTVYILQALHIQWVRYLQDLILLYIYYRLFTYNEYGIYKTLSYCIYITGYSHTMSTVSTRPYPTVYISQAIHIQWVWYLQDLILQYIYHRLFTYNEYGIYKTLSYCIYITGYSHTMSMVSTRPYPTVYISQAIHIQWVRYLQDLILQYIYYRLFTYNEYGIYKTLSYCIYITGYSHTIYNYRLLMRSTRYHVDRVRYWLTDAVGGG